MTSLFNNSTYHTEQDDDGHGYWVSADFCRWRKGYTMNYYEGRLFGSGHRRGDAVVLKAFRKKPGTKQRCQTEISKHRKAKELFAAFNKRFPDLVRMRATWAQMASMESVALFHTGRRLRPNEFVIIEEKLTNGFQYYVDQYFQKYRRHKIKDLQTLMHFTYDYTQGAMVLSDLKGTHSNNDYVFTSPTIHSQDKTYGEKDEGMYGIEKCFEHHICSALCANMLRPDSDTTVKVRPRVPSAPYEPEAIDKFADTPEAPPPYAPSPEAIGSPDVFFSNFNPHQWVPPTRTEFNWKDDVGSHPMMMDPRSAPVVSRGFWYGYRPSKCLSEIQGDVVIN